LQTQINISKSAYKKLNLLSLKLGKKESELANLAILNYNPALSLNNLDKLKKAKGIWADKNDNINLEELRNSWDREINE
jgi:hypothetical protein